MFNPLARKLNKLTPPIISQTLKLWRFLCQSIKPRKVGGLNKPLTKPLYKYWINKQVIALFILSLLSSCEQCPAFAENLTASYYTVKSCLKESGQFTMSNGKELKDEAFTCASWDYPFKTVLLITNENNGKSVYVVVSDRGPNRTLYRKGRKIDLSKAAFQKISSLRQGIIPIKIKVIR